MTESSPADATTSGASEQQIAELGDYLRSRPNVSAICHENADGDTIGAAVAMARAAAFLGCQVEVVSVDGIPAAYAPLIAGLPINARPTLDPGVAVVCDAATLSRVGSIVDTCGSWFEASSIANVDHHITNSGFGRWNFVDPTAAASCQVVASILPRLGVPMDPAIASAILAGIIRDSHGFSTSATSAATFRAAATAVESGAALEEIYRATLLDMPLAAIRLFGRLLHDLRIEDEGKIAWTVLTPGMLDACGAEHADAEGVAEFIARGTGVEIAILLRELDGATRVSLRTGPGVDAAKIAGQFDGGGHTRRAGCTIQHPPEAAIGPLLEACRAQIVA